MKYFVLGYVDGLLTLMTRKEFSDVESALDYAESCHEDFKTFIVKG